MAAGLCMKMFTEPDRRATNWDDHCKIKQEEHGSVDFMEAKDRSALNGARIITMKTTGPGGKQEKENVYTLTQSTAAFCPSHCSLFPILFNS